MNIQIKNFKFNMLTLGASSSTLVILKVLAVDVVPNNSL